MTTKTVTWKIDPAHTSATIAARHMMLTTVRASLAGVNGELEFDEWPRSSRTRLLAGQIRPERFGEAVVQIRDADIHGELNELTLVEVLPRALECRGLRVGVARQLE